MPDKNKRALAEVRMEHAEECLEAAENLIGCFNYKSAANRSY